MRRGRKTLKMVGDTSEGDTKEVKDGSVWNNSGVRGALIEADNHYTIMMMKICTGAAQWFCCPV